MASGSRLVTAPDGRPFALAPSSVAMVEQCPLNGTSKGMGMPRARLDVSALYAALDNERKAQGLSWRSLAKQAGVPPSTLSRMANGHAPHVDAFAALTSWLGTKPETYLVSEIEPTPNPDLLTELAPLLRARKDLAPEDVRYLEDVIGAAIRRFRAEQGEV